MNFDRVHGGSHDGVCRKASVLEGTGWTNVNNRSPSYVKEEEFHQGFARKDMNESCG